jgi:rare lipoprotein A (peptidoglycan hydrolase)
MRKRAAAATIVAAAVPAKTDAHLASHVRGCATRACDERIGRKWWRAHHQPATSTAVASWYGPGLYGNRLACGGTLTPGTAGVANKTLPCGTRIHLCLRGCVTVPVVDRGPYVGGRTFDLTAPVKDAIGMGGIGVVRYRVVSP